MPYEVGFAGMGYPVAVRYFLLEGVVTTAGTDQGQQYKPRKHPADLPPGLVECGLNLKAKSAILYKRNELM